MKSKYIKSNIFPIFIEILFVLSCFIVEKQFYICLLYTSDAADEL